MMYLSMVEEKLDGLIWKRKLVFIIIQSCVWLFSYIFPNIVGWIIIFGNGDFMDV
jgi:uncharacterized RDD family membrane protein YckC